MQMDRLAATNGRLGDKSNRNTKQSRRVLRNLTFALLLMNLTKMEKSGVSADFGPKTDGSGILQCLQFTCNAALW